MSIRTSDAARGRLAVIARLIQPACATSSVVACAKASRAVASATLARNFHPTSPAPSASVAGARGGHREQHVGPSALGRAAPCLAPATQAIGTARFGCPPRGTADAAPPTTRAPPSRNKGTSYGARARAIAADVFRRLHWMIYRFS